MCYTVCVKSPAYLREQMRSCPRTAFHAICLVHLCTLFSSYRFPLVPDEEPPHLVRIDSDRLEELLSTYHSIGESADKSRKGCLTHPFSFLSLLGEHRRQFETWGHPLSPNTSLIFGKNSALYPTTIERSISRISILSVFRMVISSHCMAVSFFLSSSH